MANVHAKLDVMPLAVVNSLEQKYKNRLSKQEHEHALHLDAQANLNNELKGDISNLSKQLSASNALNSSYCEQIKRIEAVDKKYGFNLKEIIKIEEERGTQEPSFPVVPPNKLPVTQKLINEFKAFCKKIDAQEELKDKKDQNKIYFDKYQEAIIFCDNRALRVLAGAGSGKSTALILRIIFFNKYLQIPLSELTVCTFTKESRKDFIEKLKLRFEQWGDPITEYQAKSTVRTFHSLAYQMHLKLNDKNKKILFDFNSQKPSEEDSEGVDIENQMEVNENQLREVSTTEKLQLELYRELSVFNTDFRHDLKKLYKDSLKTQELNPKRREQFKYYNEALDKQFTEYCLEKWISKHRSCNSIIEKYQKFGTTNIGQINLNYQLHFPNLNINACLAIKGREFKKEGEPVLPNTDKKLFYLANDKETHCFINPDNHYRLIYTVGQLKALAAMEEASSEHVNSPKNKPIPVFPYTCAGDLHTEDDYAPNSAAAIHRRFKTLIDFSYSIGKPLYKLSDSELTVFFKEQSENDLRFLKLSRTFHRYWVDKLNANNLTTFDEIFFQLGSSKNQVYRENNALNFNKLSHLMIDEFQDISPNLIKFISALKSHLVSISLVKDGSLTCVGDDYQSIYGWRGSSASYILNFDDCFHFSQKSKKLKLENNYRSDGLILANGQLLIDRITISSQKKYRPKSKSLPHLKANCCFYKGIERKRSSEINFDDCLRVLRDEVKRFNPTPEKPMYLLKTSRSVWKQGNSEEFKETVNSLKEQGILKELTIHGSKGLEAECVILLGDLRPPKKHPIRNALYKAAQIEGSYANMQIDETLRVGYVGITRAIKSLHWFMKSSSHEYNMLHFLLREKSPLGNNALTEPSEC